VRRRRRPSGELVVGAQVKAGQGEDQPDRLPAVGEALCAQGIHDALMNGAADHPWTAHGGTSPSQAGWSAFVMRSRMTLGKAA
jgi:hypothetical protein